MTILPFTNITQFILTVWGLFLAVSFGFSAGEKIADYQGTFSYYSSYFSGSFVKKLLNWVLPLIIIIESIITFFYLIGIYQILIEKEIDFFSTASLLSCALLILFLIGQRIMKDYEGAARLGIYFLLCGLPLLLF